MAIQLGILDAVKYANAPAVLVTPRRVAQKG